MLVCHCLVMRGTALFLSHFLFTLFGAYIQCGWCSSFAKLNLNLELSIANITVFFIVCMLTTKQHSSWLKFDQIAAFHNRCLLFSSRYLSPFFFLHFKRFVNGNCTIFCWTTFPMCAWSYLRIWIDESKSIQNKRKMKLFSGRRRP